MSEQPTTTTATPGDEVAEVAVTVTDELEAAASLDGVIIIPVADLPAGSTVTVTITVGPAAPPETAPAPQRYIGEGRPPARPASKG